MGKEQQIQQQVIANPTVEGGAPARAVGGPSNGAAQDALGQRQTRPQTIAAVSAWVRGQIGAISSLQGDHRVRRVEGVLAEVERVSAALARGEAVDAARLPAAPEGGVGPALGVAVPAELIGVVRPLITGLEAGVQAATQLEGAQNPEGSKHTTVDWNTRLGVPQYRSQSDNLAAPEATCNITSLSMVLERLGVGREQLIAEAERRVKRSWIDAQLRGRKLTQAQAREMKADLSLVDSAPGWDADAAWKGEVRRYLDAVQNDVGYRRVRGEHAVSGAKRDELAAAFREDAQMEDVLDFILHKAGISRTSIVGDPQATLNAINGGGSAGTPGFETLWSASNWGVLTEKTRAALDEGGAAALSFQHKGTRDRGATHIVSVQSVEDDGLRVDDPYGEVRADYNPKASDDAYFHYEERQVLDKKTRRSTMSQVLIPSRERQKNAVNGIDDWGAQSAKALDSSENKGDSSFISKKIVQAGMKYLQLFRRPGAAAKADGDSSLAPSVVPIPRPRPNR